MRRLRELILRFGGLFNKQRKDWELEEEIESHLQMHIEGQSSIEHDARGGHAARR